MSTNTPLCKSCTEKDIVWNLHGHNYEQHVDCLYGMSMYPNAHKCNKYTPKQSPEEESA